MLALGSLTGQVSDSTSAVAVSQRPAIEARFGVTSDLIPVIVSTADLARLADHPMLAADYSKLAHMPYAAWYSSQLFFSFSYYRPLAPRMNLSWSAGGFFRELQYTSTSLQRDTLYQVDVLRGDSLGHELIQYYTSQEHHSFMVTTAQISIPLAIHWSTDPTRIFMFQAGLCLAPGMLAGNAIQHESGNSSGYLYALSGEDPEAHGSNLTKTASYDYEKSAIRLKGVGFSGYASIPIALCLRLSKSDSFYGRMRLMAGVETGIIYHKYRTLPALSGAMVRLGLGIRCSL